MASPFAQLPEAIRGHLGALADDWPDEERSTCEACPLVEAGEAGVPYPFSMARDARCCTAQPDLANFLVGLAGRAGASEVVRARLADRDGVSAWGVRAVTGFDATFAVRGRQGFGREVALRCPFWVGGDHACGVWLGRSARCRAFFCRHERGLAGALTWSQAAGLGVSLEAAIAAHLVATLGGAPAAGAEADELLGWYARCAAAADGLGEIEALAIVRAVPPPAPAGAAERIVGSPRGRLIAKLRVHRAAAIADVLVPAVSGVLHHGGRVLVAGYSTFDAVSAPPSVFALLARLDGVMPWRTALAELADPTLDEALVRELRRAGVLRDPGGSDDPPETE
ncbi:MAG: hypothetical protein ABI467_14650 [Kofleriaceae bacterium]